MEASLTARVECQDAAQRDFVRLMLSEDDERPIFEEEVPAGARGWFSALDDIATAEYIEKAGASTVYATWTLGGPDWDEDVFFNLQCLSKAGVKDVYAVVEGDEGWYELWIMRDGKPQRHNTWQGKELESLFEGKENLSPFLDKIRRQDAA